MYAYQFRLIVIGDSTVGKSSLLRAFCDGKFCDESDPTVGVDFYAKIVEVKPGIRIKLQIWDTAGQERFRSITRSYYRNSVGGLILFDTTNYDTFEHANDWFQEARRQIEPNQAVFILVGTKSDKESLRQVPVEQAQQFADYHNLLYVESSSKTGHNVEKVFSDIGLKVYEQLEKGTFRMQDGWDGIKSGYLQAAVKPGGQGRPGGINLNGGDNGRDNNNDQTLVSSSEAASDKSTKKSCC